MQRRPYSGLTSLNFVLHAFWMWPIAYWFRFIFSCYDYIWLAGPYYTLKYIFIQAINTRGKATNTFLYFKNLYFDTCLEKDSGNCSATQWTWSTGWIVFGKHP